jgi:hypothetical protein
MKIRPVEAELFHVDRRTERDFRRTDKHDEANSRFSQFCKLASKSLSRCLVFSSKVETINSRTQVKSLTTCDYLLAANVSHTAGYCLHLNTAVTAE